jgi:type VI secretion system secreted protein Hcp
MPAFLKLPSIEGECAEEAHDKWIEVDSTQYSISRTIPHDARGAQRSSGESQVSDLMITKQADSSSPTVQKNVFDGTRLDEVTLHLCSTSNNQEVVNFEYIFKDVILTGYSFGGSSGNQASESLSLNFTKMEIKYIKYDAMGEESGNFPAKIDTEKSRTSS